MAYLNEFHPEVFVTSPRAGGLAKIKPPDLRLGSRHSSMRSVTAKGSKGTIRSGPRKPSKVTIKTTTTTGTFDSKFFRPAAAVTPKRTTREYRIRKILSTSPWLLFDGEDDPDNVLPPDPIHDAMTILASCVSTVMLMASGYTEIPRQHLIWTLSYLECVKDDFGHTPPNVRAMMNNIKMLDNTLMSFFDEEDDDDKSDITGLVIKGPIPMSPASQSAGSPPVAAEPKAEA